MIRMMMMVVGGVGVEVEVDGYHSVFVVLLVVAVGVEAS